MGVKELVETLHSGDHIIYENILCDNRFESGRIESISTQGDKISLKLTATDARSEDKNPTLEVTEDSYGLIYEVPVKLLEGKLDIEQTKELVKKQNRLVAEGLGIWNSSIQLIVERHYDMLLENYRSVERTAKIRNFAIRG